MELPYHIREANAKEMRALEDLARSKPNTRAGQEAQRRLLQLNPSGRSREEVIAALDEIYASEEDE